MDLLAASLEIVYIEPRQVERSKTIILVKRHYTAEVNWNNLRSKYIANSLHLHFSTGLNLNSPKHLISKLIVTC